MSLRARQGAAAILLGVSVLLGVYVAIPGDGAFVLADDPDSGAGALVALIDFLNGIEIVHILSHMIVFGGAALLLGPWGRPGDRGSARLAWRYVIIGTLLMEGGQVIVGYSDDYWQDLVVGVAFDLLVNGLSAALGVWLAARYAAPLTRRLSPSDSGA